MLKFFKRGLQLYTSRAFFSVLELQPVRFILLMMRIQLAVSRRGTTSLLSIYHTVRSKHRWKPYTIRTFFTRGSPRSWWHAANVHCHHDGIEHNLVMIPYAQATLLETWRFCKNDSLKWFIRCYDNISRWEKTELKIVILRIEYERRWFLLERVDWVEFVMTSKKRYWFISNFENASFYMLFLAET